MSSVSPLSNFNDMTFFKELDNTKKRAYFFMAGLGSDSDINFTNKNLQPLQPEEIYNSNGSKCYYIPYMTKGLVKDTFTLKSDVSTLIKTSFLEHIKTRKKRLENGVKIIKEVINSSDSSDSSDNYDEYVLIGGSHGTLIMYSILLKLESDNEIPHTKLQKIRFYPLSPPLILPNNLLSYSSLISTEQAGTSESPKPPTGTHESPTPPYLQFQYDEDFFYNRDVSQGLISKLFAFLGRTIILKNIVTYYDEYKGSAQYLKFIKENDKKIHENKYNELFIYDTDRKIVMEHNLQNKRIFLSYKNIHTLEYKYYYYNIYNSRYIYAILNLTSENHASTVFLFPIFNSEYLYNAISIIITTLQDDEEEEEEEAATGGAVNNELILDHYTKIINKETKQSFIKPDSIAKLNTYINNCFPEDQEQIKNFYERLVTYTDTNLIANSYKNKPKRVCRSRIMSDYNTIFIKIIEDLVYNEKNRWELFILKQEEAIVASCFVHFNDNTKICEIHEVCVGVPKQGYCQILIKSVIDYILDKSPITIETREFPESNDSKCKNKKLKNITIYCENDNCPACACYRKVFSQYQVEGVAEVKRNKPITRFTINL